MPGGTGRQRRGSQRGGSVATDWAQAQGNAQVSGLATSVHLEQGESTATCLWFGLQGNDCEDSHLVGVLR